MKQILCVLGWTNSSAMIWGTIEIQKSCNIANFIIAMIHTLLIKFHLLPTLQL